MRNLKKVLALALAVVMLVGMMAMGAGAATYEDVKDSDYTTAIELVSAIGGLKGNDGKFNPDKRLVRADAVLMIARVVLGEENVGKLVGASGIFTDVSAKHYAAGAIAWAYNEGIIAGIGGGKFDPNGSLYGVHFAKMLLVAMGYKADVEGFTSKDYVQKITLAAALTGLLEGLEDVELNGRITRAQAAQMCYNAVTSDKRVTYTSEIVIKDGNSVTSYTRNPGFRNDFTLCDQYGLEYVDPEFDTDTVVGGYWHFLDADGNVVLDEQGREVKATSPIEAKPTHTIKYYKSADAIQEILCNPVTEVPFTYNTTNAGGEVNAATGAAALSDISGSGVYIDVWAHEGVVYKIEYTYDELGTVVADYDEATELYNFTIVGGDVVTYDDAEDADNTQYDALVALDLELNKRTNVTFSYDVDSEGTAEWTAVTVTEKVTGTASEITDRNGWNFILNGSKYYVAEKAVANTNRAVSLTAVQNFWLDTYGNVLKIETVTENAQALLIYVNNIAVTAGEYLGSGVFADAYTLTGFDMTGKEVTFEMGDSLTVPTSTNDGEEDLSTTTLAEDELYVYTVNKQGKIATADKLDVTAFSTDFDADTTLTFAGKYITANTVFAYVFEANLDGIPGNEEYFVVKNGAHDITAGAPFVTGFYAIDDGADNDLDMVILCGMPAAPVAEPAEDLIYVNSTKRYSDPAYYTIQRDGSILSGDGENVVYTFSVYLNGEKTVIHLATDDANLDRSKNLGYGWYEYTVDQYGVYTLDDSSFDPTVEVVIKDENVYGNIALGNGRYYVTLENGDVVDITDAEIFNLTKVSAGTAGRLLTLSNSDAYENVELAIHYTADENGLFHAATIYVLNVFAAE